jgi:DNA-binding MarR family transcriptional regulator
MASKSRIRSSARSKRKNAHRRESAILAAVHGFRRAFAGFDRLLSGASGGKISMADMLALHFIAHAVHVTPGQIGSFTGLTSGSVTTMVDRLEHAGYIHRNRSRDDRRVVVVSLRPGVHQTLAHLMLDAHQEVGKMFDEWSLAQIETLVGLLEGLKLVRQPNDSPFGHR